MFYYILFINVITAYYITELIKILRQLMVAVVYQVYGPGMVRPTNVHPIIDIKISFFFVYYFDKFE